MPIIIFILVGREYAMNKNYNSFIVILFLFILSCQQFYNPWEPTTYVPEEKPTVNPQETPTSDPIYSPTGTPTPVPTETPTSTPESGTIIINMVVNDTENAADWSTQINIQAGDDMFGDRTYTIDTLPPVYAGSDWIRTAADSKAYTDPVLVTFDVTADVEVLIVHDSRITTKPVWLTANWTDTGNTVVDSLGVSYEVYTRSYTAGSSVSLGQNGESAGVIGYSVIVKLL